MIKDVSFDVLNNVDYVKFTYVDMLTGDDADFSVEKLNELCNKSDDKIIVVWNCLELLNYEAQARIVWQKILKEKKDRIKEIWLISDSKVIKAGAELLSLFTAFKINIVKSEEAFSAKK